MGIMCKKLENEADQFEIEKHFNIMLTRASCRMLAEMKISSELPTSFGLFQLIFFKPISIFVGFDLAQMV